MHIDNETRINSTPSQQLLTLIGAFGVMLFATAIIVAAMGYTGNSRTSLLAAGVLQDLTIFILPAIATATIYYRRPLRFLGLCAAPKAMDIAAVVAVYAISLPAMNWIVQLNASMHLPQALAAVEQWMRSAEDNAQAATQALLGATSLGGMIDTVAVVGILAAFSEELFFRGGMIGCALSRSGKPRHATVWLVAIAFSAMHMQFFGFVPRLLLGVWLGYLYVLSRSVWAPFLAHALNNSMVVVFTWLSSRSIISRNYIDDIGTTHAGQFPLIALLSIALTAACIWAYCSLRSRNAEKTQKT